VQFVRGNSQIGRGLSLFDCSSEATRSQARVAIETELSSRAQGCHPERTGPHKQVYRLWGEEAKDLLLSWLLPLSLRLLLFSVCHFRRESAFAVIPAKLFYTWR
jgi:hypothetical protein